VILAARTVLALAPGIGLAASPVAAQGGQGATHLLVVSGLAGDSALASQFRDWTATLITASGERYGLPDSHQTWLAEDPGSDSRIDGPSTREGVNAAVSALAESAGPSDRVLVVLFGHGSERDGSPRFNLPGPDLTADEWSDLIARLGSRTVGFVNTASASGGFIPVLSADGRVVITATRSGRERNLTRFGERFARAWDGDEADTDKDGRTSLLEAYEMARREVAREYESQDLLLSEHSLLDDDADGQGSHEPDPDTGDGRLARTFFLAAAVTPLADRPATDDPELAALYAERARLEAAISDLRTARDTLEAEEYDSRLEELLVDLAMNGRAIREREGEE
jgi:hypothetical protein